MIDQLEIAQQTELAPFYSMVYFITGLIVIAWGTALLRLLYKKYFGSKVKGISSSLIWLLTLLVIPSILQIVFLQFVDSYLGIAIFFAVLIANKGALAGPIKKFLNWLHGDFIENPALT